MVHTRQGGSVIRNGVKKDIWKRIRDSLVSHGYHQKGWIDANDLHR
jgi:hypothetical protein